MDMEKLVALCRRRGFIFQSSEIYGGINGFWDYGPLGVELKNNLRDAWWDNMVHHPPAGPDGRPAVMHVESIAVVTPCGELRRANRSAHRELFALVAGGLGLFGALYSVTLHIGSLSQALDNAVNENFSRYIERARTIYRPVLDDVWSGKQTAEAALGSVKQKVEDVLAGKG